MFLIIWESFGLFWTAESNVGLNMWTHVQRCSLGQQRRVWKNAASKAPYLQYKAQGWSPWKSMVTIQYQGQGCCVENRSWLSGKFLVTPLSSWHIEVNINIESFLNWHPYQYISWETNNRRFHLKISRANYLKSFLTDAYQRYIDDCLTWGLGMVFGVGGIIGLLYICTPIINLLILFNDI